MQDRYIELGWSSHVGEALRELRSGLQGLGGRPSLHPAWSGTAAAAGLDLAGVATPSSIGDFDQKGGNKVRLS